jgi:anti-anti-sigma factor
VRTVYPAHYTEQGAPSAQLLSLEKVLSYRSLTLASFLGFGQRCDGQRRPASEHEVILDAYAMSLTEGSTAPFKVTTSFEGTHAVLAFHGSVESGSAFELGAVLDAIIDRQPKSVVLDLSDLKFMGPAGMIAIANAEKRLAEAGTALTLRSPTALIDRLLGIMESAEASRLMWASRDQTHLGAEQLSENPTDQRGNQDQRSDDLRKVTAMPTNPDVVDGALNLLVELTRSCVHGADGVSVSLLRHGLISTVAASDQTIMDMDADQYATGQGPCLDASMKGHWFHAESLESETRWPAFAPRARKLGINAILSSPLRANEAPVGALNIYSRAPLAFDVKAQETAAAFAQKASVILSDAGAGITDGQSAGRFNAALMSRRTITLAEGVLMERYGVDADSAFENLLRLSLYNGVPLRERAQGIVQSARRPTSGAAPALDA